MFNPTYVCHNVETLYLELMFSLIWKCSTFKLNFYEQMVNEALLVKEEINVGWIFPRNPNLQDDNALFDRQNKCKVVLVDVMDCQVQTLCVKFGSVNEAFKPTPKVPITTVLIDNDINTFASSFLTFIIKTEGDKTLCN
jgi:hypothetical protein